MLSEGVDFIIRKMNLDDLQEVERIEKESFKEPWPYEALYNELMKSDFTLAYVVEVEGKVVGYSFVHFMDPYAHLINIAIDKNFQRKGLAKALLNEIINYSLANGLKSIVLEVRVGNTKAQNLYKSFGFKVIRVEKKYYRDGEDAFIMIKDLSKNETK